MFNIIEYCTSDSLNRDIIIHCYSDNKEKAINYALELANKHKEEKGFNHVIDITEINNYKKYLYTTVKPYVKIFTCIKLEEISDTEMETEINIFEDKTIQSMVNDCYGKQLLDKYQDIKNEKVQNLSINKVKEIFIEMALSQLGIYGAQIEEKSDRIFAVVESKQL